MSLITDLELSEDIETSRTYKLLSPGKIQDNIDGVEALQQAVYKMLNTEKYEYPIYSFIYGIELEDLMGKDPAYVKVELKRRISECLLQDERITKVQNFEFSGSKDQLLCSFDVISIFGSMNITREVNI
jgi:hypothetical protein